MRMEFLAPLAMAATLAATLASDAAMAQTPAGLTLDQIEDTLEGQGLEPTRSTGESGDVYFSAAMTGPDGEQYNAIIAPRDCTGSTPRCRIVTLYANFGLGSAPDASALAKLVSYNDTHYRGRSYAFGETVGVDYQVFLGEGAGREYLAARIGEFPKGMADFVEHMRQ